MTGRLGRRLWELAVAVSRSDVAGQGGRWWLDGWLDITDQVKALQRTGLVAAGAAPETGRSMAELTPAGRRAVEQGPAQ